MNTQTDVNDSATSAQSRQVLTQRRSRPVRFRLLSKNGIPHGTYPCPDDARMEAERLELGDPNTSDDEPNGWFLESTKFKAPKRIQVAGVK